MTTVSIVGDLTGGVKLTGIRFRNDDVQVAAQETRLALAINLVPLSVELAELEVNTVEVRLRDDRDEEKSKKFDISELLTALRSPIRLDLSDFRLTDLNFAMPDQEPQALISSLKMAGRLHDDLQVDHLDLVTPFADVHSSLALELQPPFALELQADATIRDVADSTTNLDIRAFGTIEQYAINAAAEIKMQNIGALVVNVAGKGTPQQFKINEATARGDRIDASATGELGWSDGLYLLADVEMTVPDTYIYISGNGQFDARTNVVDGALTWRGIQWPFGTDTPAFVSDSGEINVRGNPAAWIVDGTITLQTGALPQGNLTISGNGDRDAIALTIHDSDILGGRVRGHGNYRWRDGRPFNGRLRFDQIQAAELSSDWPGILSGDADIEGTTQPFAINIDIAKLHGEIREQSLAAHGAMSIAPGSIGFRKFDLTHGDSEVVLDGQLYAAEGVTYRLNVADVGDYTDAARGALEGSGKVSLNKSSPRLRGNLMATEIAIGDIEIASLQIEDNAVHNNEFINQTIVARGLRVNTHTFDTVSNSAIGDKDRHDLEIDLKSNYVGASLEASGALVDWQQLATMGWQGEISELQFEFSDDLTIALNSPVSVDVSGSEVLLEQSCLDIQDKEALCLRAHWIKATSVDLAAELHSVPLSTLMLLVDTDVELTQEISGQLSWSSAGSALTNALTNIEISPGRIVSTYDSRLSMDTGKGILDFQVIDGALGSGTFDLPIPGYGAVDIEFQVDDLSLGTNSPLSGSALIDMSDINILAELFPFIDSDGGRLAANLSVSGTLSSPSVEGEVTLRDATFRYRPFGTTLSDLQIDAVILANNQVDLEGRFKAGEGTGTVVTSAAYEAGDIPDLEIEITGSNLLLIDDKDPATSFAQGSGTYPGCGKTGRHELIWLPAKYPVRPGLCPAASGSVHRLI